MGCSGSAASVPVKELTEKELKAIGKVFKWVKAESGVDAAKKKAQQLTATLKDDVRFEAKNLAKGQASGMDKGPCTKQNLLKYFEAIRDPKLVTSKSKDIDSIFKNYAKGLTEIDEASAQNILFNMYSYQRYLNNKVLKKAGQEEVK